MSQVWFLVPRQMKQSQAELRGGGDPQATAGQAYSRRQGSLSGGGECSGWKRSYFSNSKLRRLI